MLRRTRPRSTRRPTVAFAPATQPRAPRRGLIGIALVLFVCVAAGFAYVNDHWLQWHPFAATPTHSQPGADPGTPVGHSHATNILVMGIDERPGDGGRSDTMLLVNLDTETDRVRVLSIPRDTGVELPGHGAQKINAAYAYGGPEMAKSAVSQLVGMPVNYYVKINFAGGERLINLLGGVDLTLTEPLDYDDPYQELSIHLPAGPQHLDGATAMGFVRFRADDRADLGRIDRQQAFLQALAKEVLTPAVLPKVPALVSQTRSMTKTDIPLTTQVSLAMAGYKAYGNGIEMGVVPGAWDGKISLFVADKAGLSAQLASWPAPEANPGDTASHGQ